MIEGAILAEQQFRHIATGGKYVVLAGPGEEGGEDKTLVKIGDGSADDTTTEHPGWQRAVVYYDPYAEERTYVRDEKTFRERFERVA